jgi:catechol 2,3-dioxygenase-like lactoylglutathione lyase family enzyme
MLRSMFGRGLGHQSVDQAGGARLDVVRASTNVFGFIVDDADKVAAALGEAGVTLETSPVTEVFGQRHFFVRDPAGTWIDVIQLVEPDPEWLAANLPTA